MTHIYTEAEVLAAEADYVALVRAIGPGFHPDTRGADYVDLPAPLTATDVDAIVDRAFAVYQHASDVYGHALDLIHEMEAAGWAKCPTCGDPVNPANGLCPIACNPNGNLA